MVRRRRRRSAAAAAEDLLAGWQGGHPWDGHFGDVLAPERMAQVDESFAFLPPGLPRGEAARGGGVVWPPRPAGGGGGGGVEC